MVRPDDVGGQPGHHRRGTRGVDVRSPDSKRFGHLDQRKREHRCGERLPRDEFIHMEITGTWTNASTSATWGAGTGSVTFNSATGGTMTFAGANLSGSEFNNITFDSSAATAQIFTMSTRALNWAGTLIISDGSSTTNLATANLGLTGGALNVGNGGVLTANASTFTVSSVTMTGGTSGTITLTTGSVTDSGNWDTSGAGSVFKIGRAS